MSRTPPRLSRIIPHIVPEPLAHAVGFPDAHPTAAPSGRPLRFAIVGAGMISQLHAAVLAELDGAELVAICSRELSRAAAVAAEHPGCTATDDYAALLARDDIDCVSVCTASGEHAQFGVLAANAGKHVLVEKPIDISLEKADELIHACERNGVQLGVVFQLRFLDVAREVRASVQRGDLGAPVQFDCYMKFWRPQEYYSESRWKGTQALDGGGALINQGIHGLDLLLHLVGDDVASVMARTAVRAHVDIEVEDTCAAVLVFKSGALGVLQATTSVTPDTQQRLELHGTNGTIVVEGTEDLWIREWETKRDGRRAVEQRAEEHDGGAAAVLEHGAEALSRELQDFCDAVRAGRAPSCDGIQGYAANCANGHMRENRYNEKIGIMCSLPLLIRLP